MKNKTSLISSLLIVFFAASTTYADSWSLPTRRTTCSANDKYCFKIIPKKLTSQLDYFSDKVAGKENAGGDKKVKKNLCRGIFMVRDDHGLLRKRWEINLVNEVSPVDALVSDIGDYVVTFDNWHSVGYGDDAVGIYRGVDGSLVKKLALTDFLTESDFGELPRSVSSIWWWGGKHSIIEDRLLLKVAAPGSSGHGEDDGKHFPINIALSSGNVLDEKKSHYPILAAVLEVAGPSENGAKDIQEPAFDGCPGISFDGVNKIPTADLIKRIVSQVRPEYPPAARAVRATGSVGAYVQVSENGEVLCAKAFSGNPLLRAAVAKALSRWKYQGSSAKYWGTITFTGKFVLIAPDGTITDSPEE